MRINYRVFGDDSVISVVLRALDFPDFGGGLQEKSKTLEEQRDNVLSQLLDTQGRILELTLEKQRLRAQLPQSNVRHLSTPPKH